MTTNRPPVTQLPAVRLTKHGSEFEGLGGIVGQIAAEAITTEEND